MMDELRSLSATVEADGVKVGEFTDLAGLFMEIRKHDPSVRLWIQFRATVGCAEEYVGALVDE